MIDPGAEADLPAPHRGRRAIPSFGRGGRIALGVAIVLLAALIAIWVVRKPIAGRVIDDALAKRGVAARYTIGALGVGEQRLTDLVIGDPRRPDLVADWVETRTAFGVGGPRLVGVRAGHVRVRGRVVDGRITLGEIDKLLTGARAAPGKSPALPAMRVDIADARMRLETPVGLVGLKLAGKGRLDDGFAGRVALVAPTLAIAGCEVRGARAAMRLRVSNGAPRLAGPVRGDAAACGGVRIARGETDIDATVGPALDRWQGRVHLAGGPAAVSDARAAQLAGTIDFAGNASATHGTVDLSLRQLRAGGESAAAIGVTGTYAIGATQRFDGRVAVTGGRSMRLGQRDIAALGAGTPLAPLIRRGGAALVAAAGRFDGRASIAVAQRSGAGILAVSAVDIVAQTGARLRLAGQGIRYRWPDGALSADARATLAGGGLRGAVATLSRSPAGTIRGRIVMAPYTAGDARLALAPMSIVAAPRAGVRIVTTARLSGPIGTGGRIDGAMLPVDLRIDPRGGIAFDPGCVPFAFDRLAVGGLVLDPIRTRLCAQGAALVSTRGGVVDGGARLGATHWTGRLGATPIDVVATGADLRLRDRGFAIAGLATRLGSADRVTRIDVAQLTGQLDGSGIAGQFSGGAGQIGAVPLLLGEAAGDWTFRGGRLALTGGLTVRDAADAPRFNPMRGHDVTLTLADNVIRAGGTLAEPTTGTKVADVTIVHDLATGAGDADLAVPGITFTKAFQPDLLTRLTYGVVAEVAGTVTGEGHIGWTPAGVTSTGRFATKDMNLAAAFGPVTGLSTTLQFTDLLNLESAPGQVATIKSVNPGVAANDGTIRYQTLPGNRVRIEGGEWPFAGGRLTLLPTLLDFSTDQVRRMTFRIRGAAADQFLQQFDFQNIDATGVFDGDLPIVFDTTGGRIEGGFLKVREGGGGIAYVGALTQKDLGFWGNLAFQALKSLRYRSLTITMNGPLAGEMVTEVRFAGVTQGKGAKSNFLIRRLAKLPFVFNIRIKAPFRGLLDSAQSFYDPSRLVQRNLQQLIREQDKQTQKGGIQPPASGTVP